MADNISLELNIRTFFGNIHDYSSQKFKSMKEAKNEEAIYRLKVTNNETCTTLITFKEVYDEFIYDLSKNIKKQTVEKNINLFKHLKLIEDVKMNDFNLNHLNELKKELDKDNLSVSYKNKILGLIKRLLIYSNKYYNTSTKITNFIERYKEVNNLKKEMEFFTYDEYKKFDSVINNFMHHVFFETLFFMGLRQGECQALTWNDIDFVKGTITLTTKIRGEKWTISSPKTKSSIRQINS